MSEEKLERIIRDYVEALTKRDAEKMLSFCTEDASWIIPEGTFKGKEELKRYLTWLGQTVPDLTVTNSGIGIMVKENKGVYEHVLAGTIEGTRCEVLAICVYEFSDDKIQNVRTVYDRLSFAKQGAKGWMAKRAVNSIIKHMEKGLR